MIFNILCALCLIYNAFYIVHSLKNGRIRASVGVILLSLIVVGSGAAVMLAK